MKLQNIMGFAAVSMSLTFSINATAADGHGDHGAASLEISVQGNKGQVEFEAATEDIYGLATQAKTDDEKKKVDAGMETLKSKIGEMLILDAKLGCKWANTEAQPWFVHGEAKANDKEQHGEVHAKFTVECSAPLTGAKPKFAFKKSFPSLNAIKVKVTTGGETSTTQIKRDRGKVKL